MTAIKNNTVLSLVTIISCHTELTTCCRDQDNPTGEALGDWVGPDGNSLPETSDDGFYVTRNMSSVSLNLVEGSSVTAGSYCCQIPRSGGGTSTHCIRVKGERTGEVSHICFFYLFYLATTSTSIVAPIIGLVFGVILAVLLIVIIIVLVMLYIR